MTGCIILEATFGLKKTKPDILAKNKSRLLGVKRKTQPMGWRSAGCVFRNPRGAVAAAEYIEMAGLKGKRIGGAEVSKKHANFIINSGNARSDDVRRLVTFVKKRVKARFKVDLVPEIIVL